ncbi:MAG: ribonuclease Y [Thermodesulfobacteriota bacterium]|nr:ribonuclease Y [Thermodesulfobacteriota bacterium]
MKLLTLIATAISLGIGIIIGMILNKILAERKEGYILTRARTTLNDAQNEAEKIKKEAQIQAKEEGFKRRTEIENGLKERRSELQSFEKRLIHKEETLDKKAETIDQKEMGIQKKETCIANLEKSIKTKEKEYNELIEREKVKLEYISGITAQEAKESLAKEMEEEAKYEAAATLKKIEEGLKESADKMGKEIIALSIQRYAADYVAERTVSVVNLPSDDMKGRIIGREGRNIRAIEAAAGIDLIVDDTPEAVLISCFDPVRREIAKISLERLINDGRIHPARVEEIVENVGQEIEISIKEAGEQAAFDLAIHGIHPELIRSIGKLKFRSSYAQNVFQHSLEVAFFCGVLASELKMNPKQAKRAGLLHDIGKAVDHEVEGPHALIGADLAKRYNESPEIIHAIAAHHDDIQPESVLAILVQAADTLSASRPGARKEMFEAYVKRLEDLERIAKSFKGVSKAYALQAGREIRVIVTNEEVSDLDSMILAKDLSKKIEKEMVYPGQIKVSVIRETRAVEYAK